jgi:hypothetical protein
MKQKKTSGIRSHDPTRTSPVCRHRAKCTVLDCISFTLPEEDIKFTLFLLFEIKYAWVK